MLSESRITEVPNPKKGRWTYGVSSCKEIHVPSNCPNRGFMFHNKGDGNGL